MGFSRPYGPSWGEIFVNGKPMHLAQWPNNLVIPMGQVLYTGSIPRNDDFANKGGVIQYDSLRVDRWVEEKNPWMAGYFHAGSDNIYTNNIFLNGKQGIRIGNRLETWAKSLLDEDGLFQTRLEEVNYQQPPYSIEYPSMVNYFDKEHQPTGNSVSGNLFVNMDEELHGKEEWAGWDSSNVVSDKSIEVEYTENGDVMFSDKELIYQLIPELKSIPLDRIGLYGGKKK